LKKRNKTGRQRAAERGVCPDRRWIKPLKNSVQETQPAWNFLFKALSFNDFCRMRKIYSIACLFSCWLNLPLSGQAPFFKTHSLGEDYIRVTVERIYQNRQSQLWFGTTHGLFLFDGQEFQSFAKNDSTTYNNVPEYP
jgi:hypothetical protein